MNYRTLMTGGLAVFLAAATGCADRNDYAQSHKAQQARRQVETPAPRPAPEPAQPPAPRQPAVVTLEEIMGNYTLTPNGKPQRTTVEYRHFTRDGTEAAFLNVEYLRPGTDEQKLDEMSGEGSACMPAATFSFETYPNQPAKVLRGAYQLNGKADDGSETCGERIMWTTDENERREGTQLLTSTRAEEMQKIFDYTLKTIRAQKEQGERSAMSEYLVK